jgi:hypothetical protein
MRNKQTAPMPVPDELPELSVKEMAFVEAIGEGLNYMDAYRKAYGAEGYSAPTLRVKACNKAGEDKIQCWLRHLRATGFERACQTLDARISDEMAFAQRCEDSGNMGAAGMARERCNRLMGLYIDRQEIVLTSSPEQTLRELELMIGGEPIEVRQH